MKKVLITGVNGQDGSYLAELLLDKDCEVHGLVQTRRSLHRKKAGPLTLHEGDIRDGKTLHQLVEKIRPGEVFHLAAQSRVSLSFKRPAYTTEVNALGTLHLLEALRASCPQAKFFQASTSQMFGAAEGPLLDEQTCFKPDSPYAVSKLHAYWTAVNYRQTYGMHICNGILFNHESPRRDEDFVTRKITRTVSRIALGLETCLRIGNMNIRRDWGYAPDYVRAMRLMLQQSYTGDYVIATGESHSVREFIETAFDCAGIKLYWQGQGVNERGIDAASGKIVVRVDSQYYRPIDPDMAPGDSSKAKHELNWEPEVRFDRLIELMMQADIQAAKKTERDAVG